MKTYLVGGAVRDKLLGRPVQERDWVVVGSSPEEMIAQGFTPVGKAFPVFLHPKTKEEYALARTERKTGPGYHGFTFHTAKDVTLKEDLARRDLTINALAEDEEGQVIDYYGGLDDLKQKCLRHITPAFSEDPVRVLRVARFAARYAALGFSVAPETLTLMHQMGLQKELSYLVAERVWAEWEKALHEPTPGLFFKVLQRAQVLEFIFPSIETLLTDTVLEKVDAIAIKEQNSTLRFAVFIHHLLPEKTFATDLGHLIKNYKIPNPYYDTAVGLHQALPYYLKADFSDVNTILNFYEAVDMHRRFTRAEILLKGCALVAGDSKLERLQKAFSYLQNLKLTIPSGVQGAAIAAHLQQQRLAALQGELDNHLL
ncbi:MAG: multifunctional tRNA nucleotidyl transferase/23-cyclic [Gammaproteobacteria bacterium]|jgi:tRNA nucleotidyltransferase (CCA-adding enzyme)|nr:multifunctional tRNA nucleotidyl transferase/23-cyclic [Gammaproteobacteria bacterium]